MRTRSGATYGRGAPVANTARGAPTAAAFAKKLEAVQKCQTKHFESMKKAHPALWKMIDGPIRKKQSEMVKAIEKRRPKSSGTPLSKTESKAHAEWLKRMSTDPRYALTKEETKAQADWYKLVGTNSPCRDKYGSTP